MKSAKEQGVGKAYDDFAGKLSRKVIARLSIGVAARTVSCDDDAA